MKYVGAYLRNFLFVIALVFATMPSAYSASYTTYQAKIVKPNGYPLEAANVNFRFTILDPAGTCILYTENYNSVNMANTGGIISFSLGSGVKSFPVSATTFFDVFNNATPSHTCDAGGPGNYVPLANDTRKIVMQFHDGSGWQTLPAMMINAVPYAMYANDSQSLGGIAAANYVRYSTIPTCTASQALHYTMAGFDCVNLPSAGDFTAGDVANALSYTPANAASFTSLNSQVGQVSTTVNAVSSTVYAVSSTVQSLTSNLSSFQNAVAVSFAAITSSQWVTSGSTISYNNNVGIGTDSPATKLDVAGGLRISMEAAACAPSLAGTLRYNSGAVEYCNGTTWTAFGVSGAGLQSLNGSTSGTQSFAIGAAGNSPAFNTVGGVHTLNIPLASAGSVTAGLLSNADYVTFANKLNATSAAVISALGYTPASASALSNYVLRANNLSDLTSSAAARANLGLGGFATVSSLDLGSASATGIIADARLANQTGVTSGTQYTKVTVDSKGRVVSGAQLTSSDVTTALGFTPGNSASGVTTLNGSTSQTQSFAVGTAGNAPLFNTAAGVHTLNIPLASAGSVTAGLLSNADYVNFSNKITSSAASIAQVLGYVPASATALGSYLVRANNLSDLTSSATARANLGLGGFATVSSLDLGSASATGIIADARLASQTGVTSGTQYTKVTVDGKGRVVSGAQLSSSDVTTALGFTPGAATSGVNILNGSASQTQSFAIGTAGTAPQFNTAAGVHTLNIPLASAGSVTAGLLSNADYLNFSNKITSSAASIAQVLGYVPASATALGSYVLRANNLSDLTSSAAARANLGLGGFATVSSLDLGSASATGIIADARLANQTGVTSGTQYTKVTVDGKGRVVSGAQLSVTDVTTALGYTPASASASTQWTTSGTTIFYNTGNIGVGTVNPSAKLSVGGGEAANEARVNFLASDHTNRFTIETDLESTTGNDLLGFRTTTADNVLVLKGTGHVGIGTASPTARLHLAAGSTTLAPLKLTSGTLLTTPASGSIEYDGNYYYITDGANTRRAIATVANPGTFDGASTISNAGNITLFPNNGTGSVIVSATTASTNSSTGALIVRGGLGVAGNINSSGTITTSSNIQGVSITATNGMIAPYIAGSVASGGTLSLDSTTHASKGNILLARNGGNVGIGIANPEEQLHISRALKFTNTGGVSHFKTPTADSFRIFNHDDLGTSNQYGTSDNNAIIFENIDGNNPTPDDSFYFINHGASGPVHALSIKGNGNIGVGTAAPVAKLQVTNGAIMPAIGNVTSAGIQFPANPGGGSADEAYIRYYAFSGENTKLMIGTGNDPLDTIGFYQDDAERMTISSGKIGIGTSTPVTALHAFNSVTMGSIGSLNLANSVVRIEEAPGTSINIDGNTIAAEGEMMFGTKSSNNITFFASDTTRMSIQGSTGNVGIGTTAPTEKLHVAGHGLVRSNNTVFKVQESNHAVGSAEIQVGQSDWYGFLKYDTATDVFSIDTALNGVATGSGGLHIKHTSGNVGIGVSNATQALHVVGNIRLDGNIYGGGNAAGTPSGETSGMWVYGPAYADFGMYYIEGSPDKISISPNGGGTSNPVMTISGSGSIGIGTSNPVTALNILGTGGGNDDLIIDSIGNTGEPTVMLRNARGTAASPTALLANDRMGFYTFRGYNGSTYTDLARMEGRAETNLATEQSGNLQFYTTYAGTSTEKMRITASGAVGIGTTAPTAGYILDVDGDMVVGNGGTSQQIRFKTASTDGAFIRFNSTGDAAGLSALEIGTTDNSDEVIKFIQTNTERMRIHTNGYVGIGTATPGALLHVNGHSYLNSITGGQTNGSGNFHIDAWSSGADRSVYLNWGSGTGGAKVGNGSAAYGPIAASAFNVSSDRRLKENIKPIENPLEKILKIDAVTFTWKDETRNKMEGERIGLIAQNVEKIFPQAVKKDHGENTLPGGTRLVNYPDLVSPIIAAIKEFYALWFEDSKVLHDKIEEQKREMASVKEANSKQSQEIKMLKSKSSQLEEQNKALKDYLCAKDPQASICK